MTDESKQNLIHLPIPVQVEQGETDVLIFNGVNGGQVIIKGKFEIEVSETT